MPWGWHGTPDSGLFPDLNACWESWGDFVLQTQTIRKTYPASLHQLKKGWRKIVNTFFITDSLFCNSKQRFKSNSNTKTEENLEPGTRNSVFLLLQRTLKTNALCYTDEEKESLYPLYLFCSTSPLHSPTWEGFKLHDFTRPNPSPLLSEVFSTQIPTKAPAWCWLGCLTIASLKSCMSITY